MAFLKINGITVPVAFQTASRVPEQIGKFGRAISGRGLRGSRGLKSMWSFTTKPVVAADAAALIQVISGQGHSFSYNSNSYSAGGIAATTETDTIFTTDDGLQIAGNTAADGRAVRVPNGFMGNTANSWQAYAPRVAGVIMDGAYANLLSADARDAENAPTGYTAINSATLGAASGNGWQGTTSLRITTSAGAQRGAYVQISDGPGSYAGTVFLRQFSGQDPEITLSADAGDFGDLYVQPLLNDTWTYCYVQGTAPGGTTFVRLNVRDVNAADSSIIYADGWQITKTSFIPYTWFDGTKASASQLQYGGSLLNQYESFTVCLWAAGGGRSLFTLNDSYLFEARESSSRNRVQLFADTSFALNMRITDTFGTDTTVAPALSFIDGSPHHYAITYDAATKTATIYKDSVSLGSTVAAAGLDLSSIADIAVGDSVGGTDNALNGIIEDLAIFPSPLSATQVSELYNSGTPQAIQTPRLIATGDFTQLPNGVECYGEVTNVEYVGLKRTGTWENNAQRITFKLMEV